MRDDSEGEFDVDEDNAEDQDGEGGDGGESCEDSDWDGE